MEATTATTLGTALAERTLDPCKESSAHRRWSAGAPETTPSSPRSPNPPELSTLIASGPGFALPWTAASYGYLFGFERPTRRYVEL
jgi:hypothetical protein